MEITRRQALTTFGSAGLCALVACSRTSTPSARAGSTTRPTDTTADDGTSAPATTVTTTAAVDASQPVIRRLDHVFTFVTDPPRAIAFMQEVLGLPQAWPFSNYPDYASGGVSLGNLNLEFIKAQAHFVVEKPAQITGMGFEPAITIDDAYGTILDARHVDHSSPMPGPASTNMNFTGVGGDLRAFAMDYHVHDRAQADLARRKPLDDVHGGRLGLVGAGELVIGVADIEAARQTWGALFAPALPDAAMRWSLGAGPAVRLVRHNRDAVLGLTLDVRKPDAATTLAALRRGKDPLVGLPLTVRRR